MLQQKGYVSMYIFLKENECVLFSGDRNEIWAKISGTQFAIQYAYVIGKIWYTNSYVYKQQYPRQSPERYIFGYLN